jgi:hypothetical protein
MITRPCLCTSIHHMCSQHRSHNSSWWSQSGHTKSGFERKTAKSSFFFWLGGLKENQVSFYKYFFSERPQIGSRSPSRRFFSIWLGCHASLFLPNALLDWVENEHRDLAVSMANRSTHLRTCAVSTAIGTEGTKQTLNKEQLYLEYGTTSNELK